MKEYKYIVEDMKTHEEEIFSRVIHYSTGHCVREILMDLGFDTEIK